MMTASTIKSSSVSSKQKKYIKSTYEPGEARDHSYSENLIFIITITMFFSATIALILPSFFFIIERFTPFPFNTNSHKILSSSQGDVINKRPIESTYHLKSEQLP